MRFLMVLLTLFSFELLAVETVQDDVCTQGDCQKKSEAKVAKETVPSPSTTQVDESGLVSVAEKEPTAKQQTSNCDMPAPAVEKQPILKPHRTIIISVVGQGVAPVNTTSPAQAYALAKRAAIADGYRLIAEKVKGVEVEGQDLIKNMMVKRSTVRTAVYAMVKNANVVETTFRDGLCEVEMEIKLSYDAFAQ